jgi:hypothetical protein
MSNPFDELTLGEVEDMQSICLDGKSFEDSSPFNLAGGVMYMHRLRDKPEMDWTEFKRTTSMGEIKAFADLINDEQPDPTNGEIQPTS